MMRFIFVLFICCVSFSVNIFGQDTLPSISVKSVGGKVIISWKNGYGALINNINIQRSSDSIKRFSTIGSVLNPLNKENGYVDNKPPAGTAFYRVFVAFEGGSYIFTRSHRPVLDTTKEAIIAIIEEQKEREKEGGKTLANAFVPSKFVFTGKDNNVIINLPNANTQKFSIKFFNENDVLLFEIRSIKDPYLILEKVNFLHAGWFKYHLYDNEILLEKYKFYIPKDGKHVANGRAQN
ncbi:MAG: hypothetical protein WKI04_08215 [Ferruginibacter sp.]